MIYSHVHLSHPPTNATSCVPSCFCPWSITNSEVVVLRALELQFQ